MVYEEDVTRALARYADQSVRLYFAVVNNGDGRKSYLRLDDVSLTVCADAGVSGLPTTATPLPPSETPRPTEAPPATATPPPTAAPASTDPPAEATDAPSTPLAPPTASPPTDATPIPPATAALDCRELLGDGGFQAVEASPWLASGNQPAGRVASDGTPGLGLRLGLVDSAADAFGYSAAAQRLILPASPVSATFRLRFRVARSGADDAFVVELRRLRDGWRQTLAGPRLIAPLGAWQATRVTLDPALLAAGAGELHELFVAVLNRGTGDSPGDVTAVELDDASLEMCSRSASRYFPGVRR